MDYAHLITNVALGTGFTTLMTALGAGSVFLVSKKPSPNFNRITMGLAAGVMIAASVWSLLIPSMERAQELGNSPILSTAGGFTLGVLFLLLLDNVLPHMHNVTGIMEGPKSKRSRGMLLFTSITMHNIPEGMSVGLLFLLAAQTGQPEMLSAAIALAIGMGIQNVPEGAAAALPMLQEGHSKPKAFAFGVASGSVEFIFGMLVVLVAGYINPIMPWLLSFSAGAMMYVVVEELIPEANTGEHSNVGTLSVMVGFLIMMILDCTLG